MSRVSVIVPVYNAEKYLSEAIESVLNQTYTDFELLLINDKSTDKSKEICEEYVQKDRRIILLENNTENHGPGPTRNIGLDNATGDFIYFMDADDWIDKSLLEICIDRIEETNADIVQFGIVYEQVAGKEPIKYNHKDNIIITQNDIKKDFTNFWKQNKFALTLNLFRKEKVKSIRFENIISGEDISYVTDAFCNAKKTAYIPKALYHYRFVQGSTSRRWNKETIEHRAVIWEHQKKFLKSIYKDMYDTAYAEVAYDNYIWAIYQLSSALCPISYKEKKRELYSLKERMKFEKYRGIYTLNQQHGINRVKYFLVKYRLDNLMLLLGPLFLRIVRSE